MSQLSQLTCSVSPLMSVSFSQGLIVGQALELFCMSSSSCRALSTAFGRAVASAALKLIGSPVCFSAASFFLQSTCSCKPSDVCLLKPGLHAGPGIDRLSHELQRQPSAFHSLGRAVASAALKLMGPPVCSRPASFSLQGTCILI